MIYQYRLQKRMLHLNRRQEEKKLSQFTLHESLYVHIYDATSLFNLIFPFVFFVFLSQESESAQFTLKSRHF